MAGRPKLRAMRAGLAELAAAAGERSAEAWLLGQIADGALLKTLAEQLGVSRGLIYMWLSADERRREAFREARRLSADALAGDAVAIVDGATPETVSLARARAEFRRWLAQCFNREQYSPNAPAALTQVDIGQLHLQAASMSTEELRRLVEAEDRASGLNPGASRTRPVSRLLAPYQPAEDEAAQEDTRASRRLEHSDEGAGGDTDST